MPNTSRNCLVIKLYGAPQVYLSGDTHRALGGALNIAFFATLARDRTMTRSRAWLVDTLWSDATPDRGRANLRQFLHALRGVLKNDFDAVLDVTRDQIALRRDRVTLIDDPADGAFLEGLDLNQDGFEDWLRAERLSTPEPPIRTAPRPQPTPEPHVFALPRIMVLPFSDVSSDAAPGLGDALAQELTGHFARSQLIDAISYFSCQTIAPGAQSDLSPDFVLSGQCRQSGDTLTIDVTLAELPSGRVVWADRHNASLRSFLAGDESIAGQITGQALRVIMSVAIGQSASKPLPDLEAHTLLISAVALMHAFERSHFQRAEHQLQEVIYRCPDHSVPRAWLAQWHLLKAYQKWSDEPAKDSMQATDAIKNALDFNPGCPLSLAIDGNIQTVFMADFDTAQRRFDAAHAINPSSAFTTQLAAVLATFTNAGDTAVALTDRAYMLSPRDPRRPFFQTLSAGSYVAGGRYDEAVDMAEASLRHNPLHLSAHRCRVIGLQLAGRDAEARQAARTLMQLDPDLRVSHYQRNHPAAQTDIIQTWAGALKSAGVPVH